MILLILLLIDIAIVLCFYLPVSYLYKKWGNWVEQKSDCLRKFEYRPIFGRRSWATRSFDIDSSMDYIRGRINKLPEINIEDIIYDPVKSKNMSPILAMAGSRKFESGIELDWTDPNTVMINARQYSDWPANAEDDINLPAKQRQRLVERVVIYLKSAGTDRTRISYEMETPLWIYVLNAAIVLLLIAAAWGMLQFQTGDAFMKAAGKNYNLIIINTAVLWIPVAWFATRISGVFRLQSISLIDNVIATFGRILPKDSS